MVWIKQVGLIDILLLDVQKSKDTYEVPCLSSGGCFSPMRFMFNKERLHVSFEVDEVALKQDFLRTLEPSAVNDNPIFALHPPVTVR
jgi:hypothetical protein